MNNKLRILNSPKNIVTVNKNIGKMEHFSRLLQVQLVSSDRLHDHPITGLQSADVIVKIHWTKVKIHWKISKIRFLKNTKRQYLVTTSGKFHPQKMQYAC